MLVKKAYLPTIDEARGVSLDDIQALRWIPGEYRSSFSQATPFRTPGNIKWEKDKERDLGEAYRPIPGFREGTNFQGYFMNPATAYGALQGDVGWNTLANRAVNPILLGITDTPHFWRTPKQGASMQGYAGEGYRYGTLPKASFVEIPHETSPIDMQRAMMDFQRNREMQGMSSDEAWDTMAEKNPDEYDVAGLFPRKITENIWGQPAQMAGNPVVDFNWERYKVASEPMDIAMRLLKQSLELQSPMTQGVEEEQSVEEEMPMQEVSMGDYETPCECAERIRTHVTSIIREGLEWLKSNPQDIYRSGWEVWEVPYLIESNESNLAELEQMSCEEILQWAEGHSVYSKMCNSGGISEADQMKYASEPMEIAFQLLKERVSLEAKRHNLEYDKKYESSPERVKYREELNRERRRRGIYGSHDHKDISHTEGGKLTLEGEHENRARHFKDKGTLREL